MRADRDEAILLDDLTMEAYVSDRRFKFKIILFAASKVSKI